MNSLGIDVGGANLKIAGEELEIIYFPMWKKAAELKEVLRRVAKKHGAERAGVVMTAELSDVFKDKKEGVEFVASICKDVFKEVLFLSINGELKKEIDDPMNFAASNWMASAIFLLKEGYRDFLFIDIGSTTTDLIPTKDRALAAKTDFERLKRKELIYMGVLRTPVFYVLKSFKGADLCPEFFAIMADVFRVTGDIKEEDYSCETPDGRGKSVEDCMRRLAKTVCCDIEELGDVKTLGMMAKKAMKRKILREIDKKIRQHDLKNVLVCGIGEFLVENAVKLSEIYGEASKLFPAYSMLKLVEDI